MSGEPSKTVRYEDSNPLLDFLGIQLESVEPGAAIFELEIQERHLNRQGSLQGGVVATLMDAACGYAGLTGIDGGPMENAVTISLNISYISKISSGRLRAIGNVTRKGRSIYFSSGELVSDSGDLIATAQGAFKRNIPRTET